jgi:hypothetical protein
VVSAANKAHSFSLNAATVPCATTTTSIKCSPIHVPAAPVITNVTRCAIIIWSNIPRRLATGETVLNVARVSQTSRVMLGWERRIAILRRIIGKIRRRLNQGIVQGARAWLRLTVKGILDYPMGGVANSARSVQECASRPREFMFGEGSFQ